MRLVVGVVLAACFTASPALAQSPSGNWNGLPDRFQLDAGYYRLSADTTLRYNGTNDVNFEKDLGVDKNVDTFWVDGLWRLGRRHQLRLAYTRASRDQPSHQLTRDFTWGGVTYKAGATAASTTTTKILGGYYRFAITRSDRFEIGPTIGIGYLWLDAGIRATFSVGPASVTLDQTGSTNSPTGAIGGYVRAWPAKRLVFDGDFLYVKVSPGNKTDSVTDWGVGARYYFHPNVGIGAQYKYNKYREDRSALSTKLSGQLEYQGFQVFGSLLF